MRLIRCHVENFGKLHEMTVDFSGEDFSCSICAENGWGKSTLAAFLRVMFFGFDGESRRKGIENERKRYAPWQGGVYGGSLTFVAGEKQYTMTRIFADKKQNDVFELRDAETNSKSEDFTENIGEELFFINSESFQRTVFIGQNDCVTATTDSINAKIGNITDTMNDLDSYEKASGALQDVLNRLNPRRKTGEIYRLTDAITRLQTEISHGEDLDVSIGRYEAMEQSARQQLIEKEAAQKELEHLAQRISHARDLQTKQAVYRQLCEACAEAEAAYANAEAFAAREETSAEETPLDEQKQQSVVHPLPVGIAAVVLLVAGALLATRMMMPGSILFAIGIILFAWRPMLRRRMDEQKAREEEQLRQKYELEQLKQEKKAMLRAELAHLKQARDAAHAKKEAYVAQHPSVCEESPIGGEAQQLPSFEELHHRRQQLFEEIDQCKNHLNLAQRQLFSLREQYDDRTELQEKLAEKKAQLKKLRQQYKQVQAAQQYLSAAKETLTARYMEPLMKSFSRYYATVTGQSAQHYRMDANTNLTVTEEGLQRETESLSRGYQDLIGLCLRLALVDAMYQEEKPFLILDDPFVNLDDQKTEGAKRLLAELARDYQVIYFTCKNASTVYRLARNDI